MLYVTKCRSWGLCDFGCDSRFPGTFFTLLHVNLITAIDRHVTRRNDIGRLWQIKFHFWVSHNFWSNFRRNNQSPSNDHKMFSVWSPDIVAGYFLTSFSCFHCFDFENIFLFFFVVQKSIFLAKSEKIKVNIIRLRHRGFGGSTSVADNFQMFPSSSSRNSKYQTPGTCDNVILLMKRSFSLSRSCLCHFHESRFVANWVIQCRKLIQFFNATNARVLELLNRLKFTSLSGSAVDWVE